MNAHAKIEAMSIPEPNSGCLLWTGCVDARGYGRVRYKDETRLAHRVSYELFKGPIPDGLCLLHKCDNPSCINPDHLRPGTQADNTADMLAKGRESHAPRPAQRGTGNGNSRYSDELIRQIFHSPLSQKKAARHFGVAQSWVWRIRRGEVWKHITAGEQSEAGAV